MDIFMNAFIGGSRWYGKPTPNSDVDLCILVTEQEAEILASQADIPNSKRENCGSFPLKFGKLNLIVCVEEETFNLWFEGRNQLKELAPVTRQQAIEKFKQLGVSK
jgi:hypothetical protein